MGRNRGSPERQLWRSRFPTILRSRWRAGWRNGRCSYRAETSTPPRWCSGWVSPKGWSGLVAPATPLWKRSSGLSRAYATCARDNRPSALARCLHRNLYTTLFPFENQRRSFATGGFASDGEGLDRFAVGFSLDLRSSYLLSLYFIGVLVLFAPLRN